MNEDLEQCVWRAVLEDNMQGNGTTFNVEELKPETKVCWNYCDGYGNLPYNLRCQKYTGRSDHEAC